MAEIDRSRCLLCRQPIDTQSAEMIVTTVNWTAHAECVVAWNARRARRIRCVSADMDPEAAS